MPFFTKKPITIEARQFTRDIAKDDHEWEKLANWCSGLARGYKLTPEAREIEIPTEEGDMRAIIGDWIIKGVEGEFYPCKPGIFEKTYIESELTKEHYE